MLYFFGEKLARARALTRRGTIRVRPTSMAQVKKMIQNCNYFNPYYWNGGATQSLQELSEATSTVATGISFQFGSSTCTEMSDLATSTVLIQNGFTYGEIINSVFIFLIFVIISMIGFHLHFRKIKIKN